MGLDSIAKFAQICSYAIGALAAVWAGVVYGQNARRERAKWADSLFDRFFVKADLKQVRDLIDCQANDKTVQDLVAADEPRWTDYLNFFEFVQYLKVSKQLYEQDVQALFGYYLGCLRRHRAIVEYIEKEESGFEYLRDFLKHERRR